MVVQKERSEQRNFSLVRLYRDDVEQIEHTLRDLGTDPVRIEIDNGEWEAESIAELATKGDGPFNEFRMRRHGPGLITFETYDSVTRLYVSNVDDLRLRGAYDKIGAILEAAQRPWWVRAIYSTLMLATLVAVGTTATIGCIVNAIGVMKGDDPAPLWVSALFMAGIVFAWIGGWHIARTTGRNGQVHLFAKADRPNFFTRKRDDLALLAIGTVVGAVVTLLLTAMTKGPSD